jgi:hypothetical protein
MADLALQRPRGRTGRQRAAGRATGHTGPMTASTGEAPSASRNREPLYSTKGKIVIVALLAVAATALGLAVASTTTGEPDSVATTVAVPLDGFGVRPSPGANVLRQSEIGIDLRPGWQATLLVDGVEIPTSQQRIVAPESQVFFTPGEGQVIERLEPGRRCATAVYWEVRLGPGVDDREHTWCFQVT